MSFYNDPFFNFFDNINNEVANMQLLLNGPIERGRFQPGQKELKESGETSREGQVVNKPSSSAQSLFKFGDDPFFSAIAKMGSGSLIPPVDVHDNGDNYDVNVSLPGVPKDKVTIDYDTSTKELIVQGDIPASEEKTKVYGERAVGKFRRVLKLPQDVDGHKISARSENGVLKLKVPKVEHGENLHRIVIESSESWKNEEAES